jgi:hypothetical protein
MIIAFVRRHLKRLVWLAIIGGALAAFFGAVMGASQIITFFNSGADRATALNLVPAIPPDLESRVVWLEDRTSDGKVRSIDPYTKEQLTGAYLRAWAQWNVSYELGIPYGLATYFSGPLLNQITQSITNTVASGWSLQQSNAGHRLQLTFYSDDGNVAVFTDSGLRLIQQFTHVESGERFITEDLATYHVGMVIENGNWRIRTWVRSGPGRLPTTAAQPGKRPGVTVHDGGFWAGGRPFVPRGVNYYPSLTPWQLFWPAYDAAVVYADLQQAALLGMNTLRIFVPFDDFGGEAVDALAVEKLHSFLDLAERLDLRVIVTLFDHRTDHWIGNWAADDLHLQAIVGPLANHSAILAWDLKNEADRDYAFNTPVVTEAWLRHVAGEVRRLAPNHLVTIGWSGPEAAAHLIDVVDFVSYHYFTAEAEHPAALAALVKAMDDTGSHKPLFLGEFGRSTWNWFMPAGDGEAGQQTTIATLLTQAAAGGVDGYALWTLYDFPQVPLPEFRMPWQKAMQGNMGILRADGSRKRAADFLAAWNRDLAAYP